jgi:hypothetical protein
MSSNVKLLSAGVIVCAIIGVVEYGASLKLPERTYTMPLYSDRSLFLRSCYDSEDGG